MRLDAARFTEAYLKRLEAVLPAPPREPDPQDERAEAVAEARRQVQKLRANFDAAPPQDILARAADLATSVGFRASLPGVYGGGTLAVVLAEEAASALVPPDVEAQLSERLGAELARELPPATDETTLSIATELAGQIASRSSTPFRVHVFSGRSAEHGAAFSVPGHAYLAEDLLTHYPRELSGIVLAHEAAHLEQKDSIKALGRSSLLEQCAEAAPDQKLERNLMWLRRSSERSHQEMERAADVRSAEIAQAVGWSRETATRQLEPMLAEFLPGLDPRSRRKFAADQASRILGASPIGPAEDRRTLGDQLGALQRRLEDRQVDPAELTRAAASLRGVLEKTEDPISRRMAWEFLAARSPWKKLEELTLTYGELDGAAELLRITEDRIGYLPNSSSAPEVPVAEAIRRVGAAPPDTERLRAVVHLASTGWAYGERPHADTVRDWARQAGEQVQSWWEQGSFQVYRDGRRVPPGELELSQVLRECRPAVKAGALYLSSPGPLSEEGRRLLEEIPDEEYVARGLPKSPGLDRLEEMSRSLPEAAAPLVAELIDPIDAAGSRAGLSRMTQLLARCVGNDELKALLRPHLDRLKDLTRETIARGTTVREWAQSDWHVAYYDTLTRAFPELLDAELVRTQIEPMLNSDHYDLPGKTAALVSRWMDERRSLVGTVMEELTRAHPSVPLRKEKLALVDRAFHRHGWRPDHGQLAWMASRLYQPPTLHASSLFTGPGPRQAEFPFFLKMLAELEREQPGVLEGLELPDPEGGTADLKSSVFERVLTDDYNLSPEKLFATLQKGEDEIVAALYELVQPETRVDELIAIVARGLARAQFVFDLQGKEQAALGVLAYLARKDPELEHRLRPLLDGKNGTMGPEMRQFLNGVQSWSRIEDGVKELALGTAHLSQPTPLSQRARALLDWADLSLCSEEVTARRRRVLEAWAQGLTRDQAGSPVLGVLEYFPDREQALSAVEYLEGQKVADLGQGWETYRATLEQTRGDVKTAQEMFATLRAFKEKEPGGTIQRGEKEVRVGPITLKVRGR
ncbi:MAG: hypothetical protein HY319_04505 [Armatimonadetes bacterium]|nr:hypothetical protein [Armatimonadota bacterium]